MLAMYFKHLVPIAGDIFLAPALFFHDCSVLTEGDVLVLNHIGSLSPLSNVRSDLLTFYSTHLSGINYLQIFLVLTLYNNYQVANWVTANIFRVATQWVAKTPHFFTMFL